MKQSLSALIVGVLFGVGLTVSEMINPAKVLAFLDFAGNWDPSLALVMGSGLLTAWVGYKFVFRRQAPILSASFQMPANAHLDWRLIGGAAVFGVGWGLAGLCPGPALAALSTGATQAYQFFGAMVFGIFVFRLGQMTIMSRRDLGVDG